MGTKLVSSVQLIYRPSPVGKTAKKTVSEGVLFVNSALKLQHHIVKNTLLQTDFSSLISTLHFNRYH